MTLILGLLILLYFLTKVGFQELSWQGYHQNAEKIRAEKKQWKEAVVDEDLEKELKEYVDANPEGAIKWIKSFCPFLEPSGEEFIRKYKGENGTCIRLLLTQYGKIPRREVFENEYKGIKAEAFGYKTHDSKHKELRGEERRSEYLKANRYAEWYVAELNKHNPAVGNLRGWWSTTQNGQIVTCLLPSSFGKDIPFYTYRWEKCRKTDEILYDAIPDDCEWRDLRKPSRM